MLRNYINIRGERSILRFIKYLLFIILVYTDTFQGDCDHELAKIYECVLLSFLICYYIYRYIRNALYVAKINVCADYLMRYEEFKILRSEDYEFISTIDNWLEFRDIFNYRVSLDAFDCTYRIITDSYFGLTKREKENIKKRLDSFRDYNSTINNIAVKNFIKGLY